MKKLLFSLGTAALVMALATNAAAQTTPAPSPQATMAPAPSVPTATATPMRATATSPPAKRGLLNNLKKLLSGAMQVAQVKYGVTHQSQELAKLKAMKKVSYSNLRFYKIPAALMPQVKTWRSQQAYDPSFRLNDALAQTSNPFLNIFANVVVTNALNNVLNNNNVSVSLNDVLNANKIGIGQVVGLFINGGGIITTIIN
jgi:hypothetical protein